MIPFPNYFVFYSGTGYYLVITCKTEEQCYWLPHGCCLHRGYTVILAACPALPSCCPTIYCGQASHSGVIWSRVVYTAVTAVLFGVEVRSGRGFLHN